MSIKPTTPESLLEEASRLLDQAEFATGSGLVAEKICDECGRPFIRYSNAKYCSSKCLRRASNRRYLVHLRENPEVARIALETRLRNNNETDPNRIKQYVDQWLKRGEARRAKLGVTWDQYYKDRK